MNVAFHELAGIAIAQGMAARLGPPAIAGAPPAPGAVQGTAARGAVWTAAFALAILSHGVLDGLVHYYPLGTVGDVVVSIALVSAWLWLSPRWLRVPLLLVGFAAFLPDIIDHTPRLLNRHFALGLREPAPLFPWHWRSGSGSFPGRTGPLWRESLTSHGIVVALCAAVLVATRGTLRRVPGLRLGQPDGEG